LLIFGAVKNKKPLVSYPVTAGWQFGRANEGLEKTIYDVLAGIEGFCTMISTGRTINRPIRFLL
jgi:hypothetical protein